MVCGRCGKENPEGAVNCASCGQLLVQVQPKPRTDGMAIGALVLGILGLPTLGLGAIAGLILGLVSMSRVKRSKGQLGGWGMALAGVVLSGFALLMIPVIAIMSAILFPVFSKAQEKARQTVCMSNMKQLSMAALMYASDWDERMPAEGNWSDAFSPYVKNAKVFVCPKAPELKCGYGFNATLSGPGYMRASEPHRTVLLFESDLGWNGAGGMEALAERPRHSDFDNFAFIDGHVQAIRRGAQVDILWAPQADILWNSE